MSPPGRRTNLALLAVLVGAVATGAWSFATGATAGRWVIWAHGVAGMGVLVLSPWKTRISRRGLARRRSGRRLSVALAVLVVAAMLAGFAHATGALVSIGPVSAMQVHVAAAIAAVPLAVWHVIARPARPRTTDLSRRVLLRTGGLVAASAAAYAATEGVVGALGLRGADRRFTGSFERGSFDPDEMPVTQWFNDAVREIDGASWRLVVATAEGTRELSLADLSGADRIRATLDCTGGWYSHQDWEGVRLSRLVAGSEGSSVLVRSASGYARRFPFHEADRLLLATRVGDRPLSEGHGFPVRLVVPGRRGFWWVKWVDRIEVDDEPWWWQPPFPLA